ncbi:MAG: DUF7268 family protein [archaeon]
MASLPDWPDRRRIRLVAGAGAVGLGTAPVVAVAAVLANRPVVAWLETAFAVGSLWFGLGLLGWAGSIMVGETIERLQTRFDVGTYWTEADSRRAMARLGGFGGGMMVGATLLGSILG